MRNLRAYRSDSFSLMLGFAACLLCLLLIAQPSWGGSGAKKTKATADSVQEEAMKYATKRYSVVGPLTVSSVDPKYLALFTGMKPIQIRLDKKKVTVKNHSGKEASLGSVKKGNRVYVCRKANDVIILVLKDSKPPRGDQTRD